MAAKSGLAAGINKGHTLNVRQPKALKSSYSAKKHLAREVAREVCGFAPYERHMMELIKIGSAASFKRALKYGKKRLGTHKRAKAKREELQADIMAQRKKAHAAHAHH
ncbi:60S ribosomal protein L36 [Perkinsus olseni]|uniref:Ribosomal protein L36e, putative n=2 Tax=Perkinsus TaxID=28000 RepID=C5K6I5_PERM5|nr:ribosomal protein L36e, putative [Perkinsus marinus ATCC 50983]XP_002776632.1 ribosomal protein L36e, putative [Perkinsus marinus ATCC 50983]XP_002788109.1 ribosomal protein L36e, putative [Perkinsus marinus ATCC 50983]KAF4665990.1 60S ribosomal protein L36 [Perkinsus olseni]EER02294.1 ribosomal protein L36e, putative [Perkinsus marinus ATCC 50983]EER08448.1 ribosomal protein L36e, putative [Perkinsus marinus ATCC 50983]EER19905.1 ribosomal protein L36e, putative [Perkinsus marinus ATCC 50|eukprot:XP_002769576.1 ribosomal protein L36e, putative [Perkinsus marinus ATCC 50983]